MGLRARSIQTVLAVVFVVAGLAALLALFGHLTLARNAPVDPQQEAVLRRALRGAFLLISAKCLVPQVILASLGVAIAERLAGAALRGGLREPLALLCASVLSYAIVGPLLLTREVAGLPAMEHANALQHVGTLATTSVGSAAALWAAALLVRRLSPAGHAQGDEGASTGGPGSAPDRIG